MKIYQPSSFFSKLMSFVWIAIGSFIAAFAVEVFFIPNRLFDGGIVGLSMIVGNLTSMKLIPAFLLLFNLPFIIVAYRSIGRSFVIQMILANLLFATSLVYITNYFPMHFHGDTLEIVVIGGAILGVGIGLIIRYGGCLDGTEILGILLNKRMGLSVGQVVFVANIFVFGFAGLIFQDWHPPLLSIIAYMVAVKVMDAVIVGLDETKSVMIISQHSQEISQAIINELKLGLTVINAKGGYSGERSDLLYVIVERLQLSDLKDLVHKIDPSAFMAIENLHEVSGKFSRKDSLVTNKVVQMVSKFLGS